MKHLHCRVIRLDEAGQEKDGHYINTRRSVDAWCMVLLAVDREGWIAHEITKTSISIILTFHWASSSDRIVGRVSLYTKLQYGDVLPTVTRLTISNVSSCHFNQRVTSVEFKGMTEVIPFNAGSVRGGIITRL
jgi:hypothetical protein